MVHAATIVSLENVEHSKFQISCYNNVEVNLRPCLISCYYRFFLGMEVFMAQD